MSSCDQYTAGPECFGHTPSIVTPHLPPDVPPVSHLANTGNDSWDLIVILVIVFFILIGLGTAAVSLAGTRNAKITHPHHYTDDDLPVEDKA